MTELPQELKDFIDCNTWTYAKSMPKNKHFYVVRKNVDNELFEKLVMFIRKYGYKGKYLKTTYKYYNYEGYKYWTMGAPLSETIIINKALL